MAAVHVGVLGPDCCLARTRSTLALALAAARCGMRVLAVEHSADGGGLGLLLPHTDEGEGLFAVVGIEPEQLLIALSAEDSDSWAGQRDLILTSSPAGQGLVCDHRLIVAGYSGSMLADAALLLSATPEAITVAVERPPDGSLRTFVIERAAAQLAPLANGWPVLPLQLKAGVLPSADESSELLDAAEQILLGPLGLSAQSRQVGFAWQDEFDALELADEEEQEEKQLDAELAAEGEQEADQAITFADAQQQQDAQQAEEAEQLEQEAAEAQLPPPAPAPEDESELLQRHIADQAITADEAQQQLDAQHAEEAEQAAAQADAALADAAAEAETQDAYDPAADEHSDSAAQPAAQSAGAARRRKAKIKAAAGAPPAQSKLSTIGLIAFADAEAALLGKEPAEQLRARAAAVLADAGIDAGAVPRSQLQESFRKLLKHAGRIPSNEYYSRGKHTGCAYAAYGWAQHAMDAGDLQLARVMRDFAASQFALESTQLPSHAPWLIAALWVSEVDIFAGKHTQVEATLTELTGRISDLPADQHSKDEKNIMLAMVAAVSCKAQQRAGDSEAALRLESFCRRSSTSVPDELAQLIDLDMLSPKSDRKWEANGDEQPADATSDEQISDQVEKAKEAFGELAD